MEIRFTQDSSAFKGWGRLDSDKFSANCQFPMVDFDRVYYIFDEGKKQILACKVRAIVFAGTEYGARTFLRLQTPTDTKTIIEYHCKLYASAEDALQSTIGNAKPIDFPKTSFKTLFPQYCKPISGYGCAFAPTDDTTFRFSDGKVTAIRANILYLAIDKQGCHVCVDSTDSKGRKIYLTKEDCIKAEIEGISIVDFADDEPAPAPAPAPESAPAKPKIHTLHFVEL